jgi:membrane-associated phospholipid phosphatase
MDALTQFELSVTLFFQGLGDWLQPVMSAISWLGSENFYLIILLLVFWCVSTQVGTRMALILMLSTSLNGMLKILFHSPRPYWVDSRVTAYATESSFGLPSGHSQNAMSLSGVIAASLRKWWICLLAILFTLLMGISRIYLGDHFLRDVVVGWLVGALLLALFLIFERPVVAWFQRQNLWQQLGIGLLSALLIIAGGMFARSTSAGWPIPEAWFTTALQAAPDEPVDPFAFEGIFTSAGSWFGIVAGLALILHTGGMHNPSGSFPKLVLRYVLGMAGLMIIYLGLSAVFPRTPDVVGYSLRFVRYSLVGLWGVWLAPRLFIKLHLAEPQKTV